MMLLFDTNPDRAGRTLNESPMEALQWDENAWRNSAGQEKVPIAAGSWFLLHASDSNPFSTMLKGRPDEFQRLPVIRFTGGDPTGKPDGETWVRNRSVFGDAAFKKAELEALDTWVRRDRKDDERPWLLFEDKPHYLTGLLILLQLAREVGERNLSRDSSGKWNIENPRWWAQRLYAEDERADAILRESSIRYGPDVAKSLKEFIAWVNGSLTPGLDSEPSALFGQGQPGAIQTGLNGLLDKLQKVV